MPDKGTIYCARQLLFGIEGTITILEDLLKDIQVGYKSEAAKRKSLKRLAAELPRHIEMLRFFSRVVMAAGFQGQFPTASVKQLDEVCRKLALAIPGLKPQQDMMQQVRDQLDQAAVILRAIQSKAAVSQCEEPAPDLPRFTILVISDLHLGATGQLELWPTTKKHIFRGLKRDLEECSSLDLVVFSGDLVHSGDAKQYKQLNDFLEELWREVFTGGKQNPPMIAVPGNHDLFRGVSGKTEKRCARSLRELMNKQPDARDFWEDPNSGHRRLADRFLAPFAQWQQNNLDFQRNHGTRGFLFSDPGLLAGDRAYSIARDRTKVGVLALNTATLHICELTGDVEKGWAKGNLIVSGKQINTCAKSGLLNETKLNILVTHHPFDWISDRCREDFEREYLNAYGLNLHLCGHMHEPDFSFELHGRTRSKCKVRVPALFGEETVYHESDRSEKERIRGYVLIELAIADPGVIFRIAPRVLSDLREIIPANAYCDLEEGGWTNFLSIA